MPKSDIEQTAADSYGAIKKIAARENLAVDEAAERVPEARRILELLNEMAELLADTPPAPVEKAAPDYLERAAIEIASKDGIPVEVAFGRISKQRPDLAERYQAGN